MRLGYELKIEQVQKLSMTPELIQAIQILQLNQQELTEYIQKELLENPVLEMENIQEPESIDIGEIIRDADMEESQFSTWEYDADGNQRDYTFERYVSQADTLQDFLVWQLHVSDLKQSKYEIGRYIIEAIDDNGYLAASVEDIAKIADADEEKVERVLTLIQTFDPPGIASRTLEECLIHQLAVKGLLTEEIEYFVLHMLSDLAENRIAHIAKEMNISRTRVQQIADLIRTLEPKPGRAFSSDEGIRYVIPDILVEKNDDAYIAVTNEGSTPKLTISSYYHHLNHDYKDEELQVYLNERMNAALRLMKSIEQRRQTIYAVADAIVRYQQGFFQYGEQHLKPLTLHEIAEEVGVHESTVSRTINGKYLQSSKGIFELKYFFSSGVAGEGGEVSSNSVKSIIREIIGGEDHRKPYSDHELVELLKEKGIAISRRTVAKYREAMHILSSSKRRRF